MGDRNTAVKFMVCLSSWPLETLQTLKIMKHNYHIIYKLSLFIFLISACKHQSIIDGKIREYISKNAHNPDSYEPISTTLIDTIKGKFVIENAISSVENKLSALKTDSSSIEFWRTRINTDTSSVENMEFSRHIKDFKYDKAELKKLQFELDSLKKSVKPNSICGYHFTHQFRARVPLGGLMLKNAIVETDKDFNIVMFVEE